MLTRTIVSEFTYVQFPSVVIQNGSIHVAHAIDDVVSPVSFAQVVILGDFNSHSTSWFGSHITDHTRRAVFDLFMVNGLSLRLPYVTLGCGQQQRLPITYMLILPILYVLQTCCLYQTRGMLNRDTDSTQWVRI